MVTKEYRWRYELVVNFLNSTAVIKYLGLRVAFKNDINILGFFSLPNIFLNTKSILGSNSPLISSHPLLIYIYDYIIICSDYTYRFIFSSTTQIRIYLDISSF